MAPRNPESETTSTLTEDTDQLGLDAVVKPEEVNEEDPPMKIVWKNVGIFSVLHLAALYSITLIPWSLPLTWAWVLVYCFFTAVGVTAGAHRLWSHRAYKAKTPLRVFLAFLQSAALQNNIFDWVRDHRVHHKYSETNADPHNATRGFFFSHVGWLMVKKHPKVLAKGKLISLQDMYNDPVVMIQKRFYKTSVLLMCFILPTVVPWYFWGETLWNSFYLASILRYTLVLNATWLVNSAAHIWGNKPYDKTINPSNNLGVALGAVGEGFHNYHHVFPHDYAASEFGVRLNVTTMFIDVMAFLGLASDRKTVSPKTIQMRKERTGEKSIKSS
ncbi:stearoyl-CoA desaturase 5-like [Mizuhopecten yessoensis]|uniref:Stearoyl-CoA desaturase n=1 Tax=Mizuhopecten yessoensis TaxID=6573 RepID=M4YUV9_MIZYE|nr:stearoyl-CoA desaturase 5-like [Mizuhopecten yessoensis]XP_021380119.1 stearoyl-CoA desaturase 5-like [Mizuhopecten yessoensis]XP_021380120.1 stearoyl-CoA desaturase 5-like [Mizuhopecten yessoensis]XP_021380121.1 stearoyl-CoA desaturase 5-like [Mizuhopecten yessoensis]AGI48676.1 stearoyl-CoA desaturase [Mizuhopecten yessoensis]AGI48677.1 stearoyl-CoA desaturase [Mizuhopecten yessoensis]OWF37515.1 Stearoyl-CoA desaturase 5 [Mizuhopecten yessoensis]